MNRYELARVIGRWTVYTTMIAVALAAAGAAVYVLR